jgi:regulation of enolase protein 1 (concanavalin A-like superfamily)
LVLSSFTGAANQLWTFQASGAGHILRNLGSGQVMDDFNNGTAAGSIVDQWTVNGGINQNWILTAVGSVTNVINPLPSPWVSADLGAVGVAGSAVCANALFTVNGSGTDIWGKADAFRYLFQPASGDCSIQAKVLSVQNTAAWAKAGVMVRETTNANSTYAVVFLTPVTSTSTNGVAYQLRAATGGSATSVATVPGLRAPCWLRLDRTGNSFVGYYSATGTNWTALGTNAITMATNVYIGLPVCSVLNGALNTSTFTNVTANP